MAGERRYRRWLGLIVISVLSFHPAFAQEPADELPSDSIRTTSDSAVVQVSVSRSHLTKKQLKRNYADTAVFQGVNVRLDVLNPVFELVRSNWHTYSIEAAVNVRLKNRFFPTIEGGYAAQFLQQRGQDVPLYDGQGGFTRIGLDINPLKKHPEQRSVLLVGVRAGTAWQHIHTPSLLATTPHGKWIADAWGEIAAGVQVDIAAGFNMGWAVRMKFLFTRNSHDELTMPYYIPGFGYRNEMNWGFDYYLGYSF